MLAQEGLIEIAHGKRNMVKDFRSSVGIDIFPELLVACPEEVITPQGYSVFQRHIFWVYDQMLLSAAKKAKPAHKPELRKRARAFVEAEGLEEIWNSLLDFNREILNIGNNIVLMMYFNSYAKTHQRLLELGMINETVYPVPDYKKTLYQLVDAVCANDLKAVRQIGMQLRPIAQEDSDLWFKDK
jgi:DNA-binding FadR family transcriptional regulator